MSERQRPGDLEKFLKEEAMSHPQAQIDTLRKKVTKLEYELHVVRTFLAQKFGLRKNP